MEFASVKAEEAVQKEKELTDVQVVRNRPL
jgi:hypothetical protein